MVSALDCRLSTVVQIEALSGVITSCFWARQVLLFTQVDKLMPENGVMLQLTSIPSRGSSNTLRHFILRNWDKLLLYGPLAWCRLNHLVTNCTYNFSYKSYWPDLFNFLDNFVFDVEIFKDSFNHHISILKVLHFKNNQGIAQLGLQSWWQAVSLN